MKKGKLNIIGCARSIDLQITNAWLTKNGNLNSNMVPAKEDVCMRMFG